MSEPKSEAERNAEEMQDLEARIRASEQLMLAKRKARTWQLNRGVTT